MPALYVTEPGAVVRVTGDSLLVTLDADPDGAGPLPERRRTLLEAEPHRLELIALVGRTHITGPAIELALDRGISVAWFSWNGRLLGRLVPAGASQADLRLRQYADHQDAAVRFRRARETVAAKLENGIRLLEELRANDADRPVFGEALAALRDHRSTLQQAEGPEALLGYEGLAAREYFQGLGGGFRQEITFAGRQRRPPPDPANALLSFGYTLLTQRLAGWIEARGLDPDLGYFHEVRPGRPSLALDLLEEFRAPVVDRLVLRVCNLRILRPEHFEVDPEDPGGVQLTRAGLKLFFKEWEACLARPLKDATTQEALPVPALCQRQINHLAMALRRGEPYLPFLWGR
ncbi:MAG: CRISPR-associated endonuclease Cas1 [bacterium]|nr:CRISPR-associated endonuclease Cas1 [bacterium]